MNPYLHIFGMKFPFYGILFGAGLLLGGFLATWRSKKRGLQKMEVVSAACFAGIGGIVGAKALSILTSIPIIIEYRLSLMDVLQNGFVFYGGLIGGFLGLMLYCKIYKLPYFDFLDVFAVSVPLGHAMGRVGCFLSGCCYGVAHDGCFSVTYTSTVDPNTPLGVPLLAVQLIESLLLFLLYLVCLFLYYKMDKKGLCTYVYVFSYAVLRFVLEFFRGDMVRGFLLGMSTSQFISVLIVLWAVVSLVYAYLRKQRNNKI